MATVDTIAGRIIRRLSLTDPEMNVDVGTPVRKIIDSVSEEMARLSLDAELMTYQFNIDQYVGTDLDDLVRLFGFSRQQAKSATGVVTVERDNADAELVLPYGTRFYKPASGSSPAVHFYSSSDVVMSAGQLRASVSVVASLAGNSGNVPSMSVTSSTSSSSGVRVYNRGAFSGGVDHETDTQLRKRFKETVFRGVTGAADHYLAVAHSFEGVTQARLFGRHNHFVENLTVVDDGGTVEPYVATQNADIKSVPMYYDAELSGYEPRSVWVINNDTGEQLVRGVGFVASFDAGAITIEFLSSSVVAEPVYAFLDEPVTLAHSHPAAGTVVVSENEDMSSPLVADTDYSVDYGAGTITKINDSVSDTLYVSYSFRYVGVGDSVSVEYDYESTLNDDDHDATLFVDGTIAERATDTRFVERPEALQVDATNQSWWRRSDGSMPALGNYVFVLAKQPVLSIDGVLSIGDLTIDSGFWLVKDVNPLGGSDGAYDAIEVDESVFVGSSTVWRLAASYTYNSLISEVQRAVTSSTQVATSCLVRSAPRRKFAVNATVIAVAGPRDGVVREIERVLAGWFAGVSMGSVIQMSDIELAIATTDGVDAVRIATEADSPQAFGVVEYEDDGVTVKQVHTDDIILGNSEMPSLVGVSINLRTQEVW